LHNLIKLNHVLLVNRKIGPRSTVWCEKEMVDAAAYEFAEVKSDANNE